MALTVRWYDGFCFAMVAVAAIGSAGLIWRRRRHVQAGDGAWSGGGSSWRGLNPAWLVGGRAVAAGAMAALLACDVVDYGFLIFVYYTEWTFSLVIFYFALGTVISAHSYWKFSKRSDYRSDERTGCLENHVDLEVERSFHSEDFDEKKEKAGFWGCTMLAVYQICAGAVMLTDVVFWCLIVPFLTSDRFSVNLLMGSMHSLNLVFLLLDTALNSMPFTWFGMSYFVLWSCAYITFQWILHACGFTWWPYPFLELATPWAPLWYFCMALVHVPCYFSYYAVVKAKDRFFSKWFPNSYIRASS